MILPELSKQSFDSYIEYSAEFKQSTAIPEVSVVIVAFNTNYSLIECLEALKGQTNQNFETIVVDNGKNESVFHLLDLYALRYYRLNNNYLPSLARNIGILKSKAKLVCFIDDDAIAHPEYIQEHWQAHQQKGILGVRGKILPKTGSLYNRLAKHYDLGDMVIPSYIDMENNASFPTEVLIEAGGFNPEIFAGEGAELSYRIVNKYGDRNCLVYWPKAVVFHDFSQGIKKYVRKTWRGAKMRVKLERLYPDFWNFIESYHPFPAGEIHRPRNLIERGQLAFARRLGRLTQRLGYYWYCRKP